MLENKLILSDTMHSPRYHSLSTTVRHSVMSNNTIIVDEALRIRSWNIIGLCWIFMERSVVSVEGLIFGVHSMCVSYVLKEHCGPL